MSKRDAEWSCLRAFWTVLICAVMNGSDLQSVKFFEICFDSYKISLWVFNNVSQFVFCCRYLPDTRSSRSESLLLTQREEGEDGLFLLVLLWSLRRNGDRRIGCWVELLLFVTFIIICCDSAAGEEYYYWSCSARSEDQLSACLCR